MNFIYTKLPPTIKKIRKQHFDAVLKIIVWLGSIGCDTSLSRFNKSKKEIMELIERTTSLSINVYHDNDMVEIGPLTDDPEGQLFFIETAFSIKVDFLIEKLRDIDTRIHTLRNPSPESRPELVRDGSISLDYDSYDLWTRDLKIGLVGGEPKLIYELRFSIKHSWGSSYKKGQKRKISGYVD